LRYAKKIAGIYNIYTIIGGFHLSGKIYEDIIDPTLDELVKLDARFIVSCHCRGWKATNKIIQLVPDGLSKAVSGQSSSFSELKENDRLLAKTPELAAIEISKDMCAATRECTD
jgi:hypothetical protein